MPWHGQHQLHCAPGVVVSWCPLQIPRCCPPHGILATLCAAMHAVHAVACHLRVYPGSISQSWHRRWYGVVAQVRRLFTHSRCIHSARHRRHMPDMGAPRTAAGSSTSAKDKPLLLLNAPCQLSFSCA